MKEEESSESRMTAELFELAFRQIHETKAANDALMFLLLAMFEQFPYDKNRLLEAMTRYYDSMNSVSERDSGPNKLPQQYFRQRMDFLTELFCK